MYLTVILLVFLPHFIRGADDRLKDGPCNIDTKTDVLSIPRKEDDLEKWYRLSTNTQNPNLKNRKCYQFDVTKFDGGWDLQTKYDDKNNKHHSFLEKVYRINGTNSLRGQTPDDNLYELRFSGGKGRIFSLVSQEKGMFSLFHACKEYGNQHRDYFDIRSRIMLPKETLDRLKKIAKDLGDDREFVDFDFSNCN